MKFKKSLIPLILIFAVFIIDQASKMLIVKYMTNDIPKNLSIYSFKNLIDNKKIDKEGKELLKTSYELNKKENIYLLKNDLSDKEKNKIFEVLFYIEYPELFKKDVKVIGEVIRFKFVYNKGIAFGIGNSKPSTTQNLIFTFFMLGAIGLIIYFYKSIKESKPSAKIAFALILGGAIGNLFDRIFGNLHSAIMHGTGFKMFYFKVVDFIDMGFKADGWRWHTYNVADIAVVFGVVILGYHIIFKHKEEIFVEKKKNVFKNKQEEIAEN